MPSYDIAHINEQGQDIIIVPVDSDFGLQQEREQKLFIASFQRHCMSAGLHGVVVPVWEDYSGIFHSLCPNTWTPFFETITMGYVLANINRKVSW